MPKPNAQTICETLTALRRFFVDFENSKYTRVLHHREAAGREEVEK